MIYVTDSSLGKNRKCQRMSKVVALLKLTLIEMFHTGFVYVENILPLPFFIFKSVVNEKLFGCMVY